MVVRSLYLYISTIISIVTASNRYLLVVRSLYLFLSTIISIVTASNRYLLVVRSLYLFLSTIISVVMASNRYLLVVRSLYLYLSTVISVLTALMPPHFCADPLPVYAVVFFMFCKFIIIIYFNQMQWNDVIIYVTPELSCHVFICYLLDVCNTWIVAVICEICFSIFGGIAIKYGDFIIIGCRHFFICWRFFFIGGDFAIIHFVFVYVVVLQYVVFLLLYAVNFSIYVVIDLLYAVVLVRVLSLYAVIFYVVSFFLSYAMVLSLHGVNWCKIFFIILFPDSIRMWNSLPQNIGGLYLLFVHGSFQAGVLSCRIP